MLLCWAEAGWARRCGEAAADRGRHQPGHAGLRRLSTAHNCCCGGLRGVVELLLGRKGVSPILDVAVIERCPHWPLRGDVRMWSLWRFGA